MSDAYDYEREEARDAAPDPLDFVKINGRWYDPEDVPDMADVVDER